MEFSRPEYWSGWPFPSPGDLPNPGIESRSPALQVDSLPAEPQGKPKNTGVGSLSLLWWIFLTQESNWGLLHFRRILYQLSYKGSLITSLTLIKWPPCVYVLWSVTCWFLLKLTLGLFIWHALANWTIKTWLKQGLKKSLLSISAPISFDPFIFFSEDMYRQFRWKWDMWTRA